MSATTSQEFWSQLLHFTQRWKTIGRKSATQPLATSLLTPHAVDLAVGQAVARLQADILSCLQTEPGPSSLHAQQHTLASVAPQFLAFLACSELPPSTVAQATSRAYETLQELLDIHLCGYENTCRQYMEDSRSRSAGHSNYLTFFDDSCRGYVSSFTGQLQEIKAHYKAAYARALDWSSKKTPFNAVSSVTSAVHSYLNVLGRNPPHC
jgi:hypothetical protein